jgi:hypothetical protein
MEVARPHRLLPQLPQLQQQMLLLRLRPEPLPARPMMISLASMELATMTVLIQLIWEHRRR